jgi:hypothetical protein
VYCELNTWIEAAAITTGRVFRRVSSAGKPWGEGVTEKLAWHIVKEFATKTGMNNLAPHDLRRYAESRIMPNRLTWATRAGLLYLAVRHNPEPNRRRLKGCNQALIPSYSSASG